MFVGVYIATDLAGEFETKVVLHHFEKPNWTFLGFDIILIGLTMATFASIIVLKQKTKLSPAQM